MTILYATASMQMFTNLPKDVITNGWHWETDDSLSPGAFGEFVAGELETFYGTALNSMVANYVTGATMRVKVYDMTDPEPRTPVYNDLITPAWGTKATTVVPTEVSAVLSFQGAPLSGVPQARRRNRVYIGGLNDLAITDSSTTTFPTLFTSLRTQLGNAASAMLAANTTALQWVGASRATGLLTTFQIAGGWVDNTPDTQRRRGVLATSRTLWT